MIALGVIGLLCVVGLTILLSKYGGCNDRVGRD